MSNDYLLVDSSCSIPAEIDEQYDYATTNLIIHLDGKEYIDRKEITTEEVLAIARKTNTIPKTSTQSIGDLMEVMKKELEGHDHLFVLPISSKTSSEYSYMVMAVEQMGLKDKITILDSLSLVTGQGLEAIAIMEDFKKDLSVEEIIHNHEDRACRVIMDFVVDNMTWLYKGGRCSGLAYLFANTFHIHPLIHHKDGKLEVKALTRGKDITKGVKKLVDEFKEDLKNNNIDLNYPVFLAQIESEEQIKRAMKELQPLIGDKMVYATGASAVIVCHTGCETFGISYIFKTPRKAK
jgi:DegV family protein with EDD domain